MSITFACPQCKTEYTVNDLDAGKKSDCKACGQRIEVPKPTQRLKTRLGEVLPTRPVSDPFEPKPIGGAPTWELPRPKSEAERAPEPAPRRTPRRRERSRRESRASTSGNETTIRFQTDLSPGEIKSVVADELGRLGYVSFHGRGNFDISGGTLNSFLTDVRLGGQLYRGRYDDEWAVRVYCEVKPSGACWTFAILGLLFFLLGMLVLIVPYSSKGNVQRSVENALRDVQDAVERLQEEEFA